MIFAPFQSLHRKVSTLQKMAGYLDCSAGIQIRVCARRHSASVLVSCFHTVLRFVMELQGDAGKGVKRAVCFIFETSCESIIISK